MTTDTPQQRPSRSIIAILERRRTVALVTAVIGIILVALVVSTVKPKYGAMTHVLLLNDTSGRDPSSASFDLPTLATGTVVLGYVKRELNLPQSIDDLQKQVTAHVSPKSSIMTIAYRDHDKARAIAVPNAVADEFVNFYATLPHERSAAELKQLSGDLATGRQKVQSLDRLLEAGSAGHTYVGSQTSLDSLAQHLGALRDERALAAAQLAADSSDLQQNTVTSSTQAKIFRYEMLQSNPTFRALQTNVANDESQYTTTSAGVTDNFPGLRGARDKVDREKQVLAERRQEALTSPDAYSASLGGQMVAAQKARSAVAGDQMRVKNLDGQITALNDELTNSAASSGDSLGAIRAQRDAAEADYQALALRYTNAQGLAAESNALGQATVVDRAVAAEPSLVGPNLLLLIGFALAMIFAVLAAYLAEMVNPRLIASDDVETLYGRPTLATLRHR